MTDAREQAEQKTGHTKTQWMLACLVVPPQSLQESYRLLYLMDSSQCMGLLFSANSTLVLYGLESGWMSPMTKVLQSEQSPIGAPISDSTVSLVASILCMFGMLSTSVYTYIADKYGRKTALITMAVNQALSWIFRLSWKSTTGLIVARAFSGIASGGCFNIVPMYVKEISQDNIRGLLGSLLAVSQNTGILLMYVMGVYLDYNTILWIVFAIPLVIALLMFQAPESPAFLVYNGKFQDAVNAIAFLRGLDQDSKIVQNEVDTLKNQKLEFENIPKISLASIFRNKVWRRNVILILLIITVHASNGAFSIVTYASSILTSSGVQFSLSPEMQAVSFPAVMILGSVISMSCIEKFGRKPLLAGTLLVSAGSMSALASAQLLYSQGFSTPSWLPVLAMVLSVFAYAAGVLPLPFIIMSEIFNYEIRAKVMGLVVSYSWFITFLQLLIYAPISSTLGQHAVFFCFSAINLTGFFVCLIYLPETKGKSDEEIEAEVVKE